MVGFVFLPAVEEAPLVAVVVAPFPCVHCLRTCSSLACALTWVKMNETSFTVSLHFQSFLDSLSTSITCITVSTIALTALFFRWLLLCFCLCASLLPARLVLLGSRSWFKLSFSRGRICLSSCRWRSPACGSCRRFPSLRALSAYLLFTCVCPHLGENERNFFGSSVSLHFQSFLDSLSTSIIGVSMLFM